MEKLDLFGYSVFPHKYKQNSTYRTVGGVVGSIIFIIFFIVMVFYTIFAPDTNDNFTWYTGTTHPNLSRTPKSFDQINIKFDGVQSQLYLGINAVYENPIVETNFTTVNNQLGNCATTDSNLYPFCDQSSYYKNSVPIEEIATKEYAGIKLDVKVVNWGGNGTNGYNDLQENFKKQIYDEENTDLTISNDDLGQQQYIPNQNLENTEFKLQTEKKIFPFTSYTSYQPIAKDTVLYPIFNSDFSIQMNGELLITDDDKPGKEDVIVISVMAEKEWLQSQTVGLGFIFDLFYHNKEFDKLSGEDIETKYYKTLIKYIDNMESIWVKVGDFFDIFNQYGTKQAPVKREYVRLLEYDVESLYVDNNICNHFLCSYRTPEMEEIMQITNVKNINRDPLGISEEDREQPLWSKTFQQQLDYNPTEADIVERVTLAQFWLMPSLKAKLEKQNYYAIRQKLEINFSYTIILLTSLYMILNFFLKRGSALSLGYELKKNNIQVIDYKKLAPEHAPPPPPELLPEGQDEPGVLYSIDKFSDLGSFKPGMEANENEDENDPSMQRIDDIKPRLAVQWEKQKLQKDGIEVDIVLPGFKHAEQRPENLQDQIEFQKQQQINKSKQNIESNTLNDLEGNKPPKSNQRQRQEFNFDDTNSDKDNNSIY